ncbi:MAG: hypothetical protein QMD71_07935 [bacterium]|nr:hypothetical protein [bacterium]
MKTVRVRVEGGDDILLTQTLKGLKNVKEKVIKWFVKFNGGER